MDPSPRTGSGKQLGPRLPPRRSRALIVYTNGMATVIVQGAFSIDPKERDRFVETSIEGMRLSREEPGCLEYVIAADPLDPQRAILSERWESMDHLHRHLARQKDAARPPDRPVPRSADITFYEVVNTRPLS